MCEQLTREDLLQRWAETKKKVEAMPDGVNGVKPYLLDCIKAYEEKMKELGITVPKEG